MLLLTRCARSAAIITPKMKPLAPKVTEILLNKPDLALIFFDLTVMWSTQTGRAHLLHAWN